MLHVQKNNLKFILMPYRPTPVSLRKEIALQNALRYKYHSAQLSSVQPSYVSLSVKIPATARYS